MLTKALLLAALAIAPSVVRAAPCTSLKQNILTSDCPASCDSTTCVLYSPSQKDGCQPHLSSGDCRVDDSYVLPGQDETCDLTYQCLDSLVDVKKKWYLALTVSNKADVITTAPVTEIKKIDYPANGKVFAVQVAGGLGKNARGNVKNVLLDDSFFKTPDSVTSFYLSELNLPAFLDKIDYSKRKWNSIAFTNANLDQVPVGLNKLNLTYVELSKNYITAITDATPYKFVTTLMLHFNDLTDWTINLPSIVTLNLTGNPLGKIPEAIFKMKTLEKLSMRACNLTNVQLDATQFTFLEELQEFDSDLTVTDCGSGYIPRNLTSGLGTVCLAGVAPTSAPISSGSGGSSNSTTIVVVGIVVAVVVIAALAFFLVCRNKKSKSSSTNDGDYISINKVNGGTYTNNTTDTGYDGADTYGSSSIWNDPDLLAVRVEFRDIEPIKLLSRGGFGEVWLGLYMNENVAIKRLLADKKTMTDALAFASEIKIMARLDHPKIVHFIGVAWTNALTIQAITEFMDCGDLKSLLDSSRASSLTWANLKCQIAIDIADALVYLHTLNPKLIHRDLKSRNVLIDANAGAKLSDFGISRNRSVEETMTAGVGTARWIAPEVILGGHYTEFADIYSFGVVLSELDTNKAPFHDATNTNGAKMQDVTILQLVSAGKLQPSFNTNCPEPIIKLAKACLSFDPAQRPSAIHISYELRKILKDAL